MDTFTAKLRSDKRAKPETKNYRFLSIEECRNLGGHSMIVDLQGNIARVAITSVKTWKTRPDVRVGWKFGLYEYGAETITTTNEFFVIEVDSL